MHGLMGDQSGSPEIVVAVIDGPADVGHPDLAGARIAVLPGGPPADRCLVPESAACRHGTFVLGMLCARRGTAAPAICPGCTILLRPVLCEAPPGGTCPDAKPADLAAAVVTCVDSGARIINLSLGLRGTALGRSLEFDDAVDHALRRDVLVVAAAGNHGLVGPSPLVSHPWLIPVTACDWTGRMLRTSNIGIGVGRAGLAAPGLDVMSTVPGGYQRTGGTSVAAPFVTGAAALLWAAHPGVSAAQLRAALLRSDVPRHSVVPPLLDASASLQRLASLVRSP
jgi:subtilisin family serine protease